MHRKCSTDTSLMHLSLKQLQSLKNTTTTFMKTATKAVQLPHLGINAYEVDGRPYVSMSEIVKATRPTSKKVDPLTSWLRGAQNPSDANGSQGFPQEKRGAQSFECNVPRAQGGTSVAQLFSPQLAARFWASELSSSSTDVVKRALNLVTILADVALNDLCQEALGLKVTPSENLTAAVRLQADLTIKAPDIQRLKLAMYQALLPHLEFKTVDDLPKNDLYYPIYNEIKYVVNALYERLDEGVQDAIKVVQKSSPRPQGKRAATKYSCLTEEARAALKPVVNAHILAFSMLRTPATLLDVKEIVSQMDKIYPRY